MTGRELYLKVKAVFADKKGERFFSFPLLWAAICEKRSLKSADALSEQTVAKADAVLEDAALLCSGEPIQYYLGRWEFCGHEFLCREGVLIPREDTEQLVKLCAERLPENGILADLCCGSGCVGISVLHARPDCTCISFDVSEAALNLTKENALRLGVAGRMKIIKRDLLAEEPDTDADLYACNPPYIPTGELSSLPENVRREPALALDGGGDGLVFYRRLKRFAEKTKKPFVCETGFDQKKSIIELFGIKTEFFTDSGGRDRCFAVQFE